MCETISVLVIEDNPGDAALIQEMLSSADGVAYRVNHCSTLLEGLRHMENCGSDRRCDVVLLDLDLPDSFGLETFRRAYQEVPYTPIVVLSGSTDESVALEAVREGAQDFVPKANPSPEVLRRTLKYAIERHLLARQLEYLANHDQLTDAYNRHCFKTWIDEETARAQRYRHPITLLMLDIDEFKSINDRHGHGVGDKILIAIASELKAQLRTVDRVFRFGGDEFLVVLPETTDEGGLVAARLSSRLQRRLQDEGLGDDVPSVSIGTATWMPESNESIEAAIERADMRMYYAKNGDAGVDRGNARRVS